MAAESNQSNGNTPTPEPPAWLIASAAAMERFTEATANGDPLPQAVVAKVDEATGQVVSQTVIHRP